MDIRNFADNVVLEMRLPNTRKYIKVTTTGETDKFIIDRNIQGVTTYDESETITYQECKHLVVDAVVNGYVLEKNMLFPQGFMGLCRELAAMYREQQATSKTTA